MSIHASKGLEFDHVFVAALEEQLLPFTLYARETEKPGAEAEEEGPAARRRRNRSEVPLRLEEERRLLYVAMTRARRGLYLSWTGSRHFNGRHLSAGPSRFLAELETLIPLAPERPRLPRDPQMRLF